MGPHDRDRGEGAPEERSDAHAGRGSGCEPGCHQSVSELAILRAGVDACDGRLVELLNERARLVVEIGQLKRAHAMPTYAPHREAEVLARVLGMNRGPLPGRTMEAVFRELMSGSFVLEQPPRVAYLGPPGSFSHLAAVSQLGSSVDTSGLATIAEVVMDLRRGNADYAVVPIENSTGGGIAETLDALIAAREEVSICSEVLVAIRHNLLATCAFDDIRAVYSKPEVFAQCRRWLEEHLPRAAQVPVASSSRAVMQVADPARAQPGSGDAAIGSALAGRLYGLHVLRAEIEDEPGNVTRFFVVGKRPAGPTGDDKTAMLFSTGHEPGALVRVLTAFERSSLNLTHIEKRPCAGRSWSYAFFVEFHGHADSAAVTRAIADARASAQDVVVLGSYPRATRVL